MALFLTLTACPSPRVHPRAAEEIQRGYRYLAQDDLERAEVAFEHALEFNPDIPEALNGAAVVARRDGRDDEARKRLEQALSVAPDLAEARVNLGELQLAQGYPEAAEESFRDALHIDPDLVAARLDLARALVHRGQRDAARRSELWAAARREYLHLAETSPGLAEAQEELGFVAYASGDLAMAEKAYRRASTLAPERPEALLGLCDALASLGRCQEAESACRRCLEAGGGDSPRPAGDAGAGGLTPREARARCRQSLQWIGAQTHTDVCLLRTR